MKTAACDVLSESVWGLVQCQQQYFVSPFSQSKVWCSFEGENCECQNGTNLFVRSGADTSVALGGHTDVRRQMIWPGGQESL